MPLPLNLPLGMERSHESRWGGSAVPPPRDREEKHRLGVYKLEGGSRRGRAAGGGAAAEVSVHKAHSQEEGWGPAAPVGFVCQALPQKTRTIGRVNRWLHHDLLSLIYYFKYQNLTLFFLLESLKVFENVLFRFVYQQKLESKCESRAA